MKKKMFASLQKLRCLTPETITPAPGQGDGRKGHKNFQKFACAKIFRGMDYTKLKAKILKQGRL